MALADDLVASYFGQAKTANLMSGDKVVASGGSAEWTVSGSVATAVETFGPFRFSTVFDSVALVDASTGKVIERYPLGGEVKLVPGMRFVHRFAIGVD